MLLYSYCAVLYYFSTVSVFKKMFYLLMWAGFTVCFGLCFSFMSRFLFSIRVFMASGLMLKVKCALHPSPGTFSYHMAQCGCLVVSVCVPACGAANPKYRSAVYKTILLFSFCLPARSQTVKTPRSSPSTFLSSSLYARPSLSISANNVCSI